jgi:hypothetical protein
MKIKDRRLNGMKAEGFPVQKIYAGFHFQCVSLPLTRPFGAHSPTRRKILFDAGHPPS